MEGGVMAKYSHISISEVRAYLLDHEPMTTGELVKALKVKRPGHFGRVLATFGYDMGLIKFKRRVEGVERVFWKANPHYNPPEVHTRGGHYA